MEIGTMETSAAAAAWDETRSGMVAGSEEGQLIARCQAGDREAQETLVRRYQQKVYRVARALLGNPEDACDATQDALVAMLHSLPHYRGEAGFQTWLYRLATNICLMERRRLGRRTRLLADLPDDIVDDRSPQSGPETSALRREIRAAILTCLAHLPPELRAVAVLRELEGLSYEEIAETLQIPLGTVQSRLSRGRRVLRQALLAQGVTPQAGGNGS
jgi:RNA polymerase sigma-70 factor (ECF subfamily)